MSLRALCSKGAVAASACRLPRPPAAQLQLQVSRTLYSRHAVTRLQSARAAPLPPLAAPSTRRGALRCFASGRRNDDKSWREIAAEAKDLATDLAKKVGSTVSGVASKVAEAAESIVPTGGGSSKGQVRSPLRREREEWRRRDDIYRPEDPNFGGGLVGSLLGKAVGGVLRSAVGALGEQLREAAERAQDVQDQASRLIESSSKVRAALGGSIRVGAPVSQSSSSSSINGRSSQTVTLIVPVVGANGRTAQAQVRAVEGGGSGRPQLSVSVRLPNGQTVDLDDISSPAAQTIDVEWRSVDDK